MKTKEEIKEMVKEMVIFVEKIIENKNYSFNEETNKVIKFFEDLSVDLEEKKQKLFKDLEKRKKEIQEEKSKLRRGSDAWEGKSDLISLLNEGFEYDVRPINYVKEYIWEFKEDIRKGEIERAIRYARWILKDNSYYIY